MWKEWIFNYHGFNPMKILLWKNKTEAVLKWLDKETDALPPPLVVTVDPTNLCTINCIWCKNRDFKREQPVSIPDNELMILPEHLTEWGVKSIILSGGEPLLHPKINEFLLAARKAGLQIGLKTNGLALNRPGLRQIVLESAKWIGFSIDAATSNTYLKVKKSPIAAFEKVIGNIKWLAEHRTEQICPILTMKYIIHHYNYGEMYAFADMAKKIGVDEVHFRPMYMPSYTYTKGVRKTAEYYLRDARKDFEDDHFHIYGIVQKYEREWNKAVRFKQCVSSALSGVFAADGYFYICTDRRGDRTLNLGPFADFAQLKRKWGSNEHREKLLNVVPQLCAKCGMTLYNEIIEHCVRNDGLLMDFL